MIKNHKHMVNLTAPDQVNAAMAKWLQETVEPMAMERVWTMAIDNPYALRDAFGAFMTGVTVVTAYSPAGKPLGFTANSFTSVSLDPPLLLVCLARRSANYAALTSAVGFAVNILAEGQRDIARTFAGKVKDRFASVAWQDGPNGSPCWRAFPPGLTAPCIRLLRPGTTPF